LCAACLTSVYKTFKLNMEQERVLHLMGFKFEPSLVSLGCFIGELNRDYKYFYNHSLNIKAFLNFARQKNI